MFTYEEIIKDWQKLGDATTLIEKSELSNKYNAKSNSKKVIETAIIVEMNNVRKNKENFTIKDVVWFNRNISSTDNYKKLSQLLSNENSSFVEFYKNYYYNKYHERGGQQDGLFAEMLDRREQGKKNQAGGEERQDGGQAGDGGEQAREGAEDQG